MISAAYITEWRNVAPWQQSEMVEQDLLLSRVLIELYNHPKLAESLAFRGGTALHKLFLQPAARYSEDIDLVQVRPEPIGNTINAIRELLDPLLGTPQRKLGSNLVTLKYKFNPEDLPNVSKKLKIEINSREHSSLLGFQKKYFSVNSRWFSGETSILTYSLDELLGSKMCALYGRKKGRDLFDLHIGLQK